MSTQKVPGPAPGPNALGYGHFLHFVKAMPPKSWVVTTPNAPATPASRTRSAAEKALSCLPVAPSVGPPQAALGPRLGRAWAAQGPLRIRRQPWQSRCPDFRDFSRAAPGWTARSPALRRDRTIVEISAFSRTTPPAAKTTHEGAYGAASGGQKTPSLKFYYNFRLLEI